MVFYGLKNCDTCRKALKYFPNAEFRDVRVDGVAEAVLAAAFGSFGDALVNTRSTTWRNLSAVERAVPAIDLLVAYPTLMKRPLIVDENGMYLGWTQETRTALGVS